MKRLISITVFLVFLAGQVWGVDYYINSSTGSDATGDGSSGNPWATIHKALRNVTGDGDIVYVAAGNYYDEGNTAGFVSPGASTVTFIASGQANVRIYESAVYTTYAYRFTTGTGKYIFSGPFLFDMDFLGDGTDNTNKYFFNAVNVDIDLEFNNGVEIDGGGLNNFIASAVSEITLDDCYYHNLVKGIALNSDAIINLNLCHVADITAMVLGTNVTDVTVNFTKNTFEDIGSIAQSGTTTYTNVTLKNNIIHSTSTGSLFSLENVAAFDVSNNITWKSGTVPAPRTTVGYGSITLDHADFYDNSYYLDGDFTTGAVLNSTSYAIGRASDGGNIGCDQTPGTKQYISTISKKVALVGDSFTYGTGVSSLEDSYGGVLEADPDLAEYTWVRMPGDTTRHLGISGTKAEATHNMAQEFAVSEKPEVVALLIGVNNINGGDSDAFTINQIKATLANLTDLGVDTVIYTGTQIENGSQAAPVYTQAVNVESAVDLVADYKVSLSQNVLLESGWNTDVTGLYAPDDLHFNVNGHAFLANLLKTKILEATAEKTRQKILCIGCDNAFGLGLNGFGLQ